MAERVRRLDPLSSPGKDGERIPFAAVFEAAAAPMLILEARPEPLVTEANAAWARLTGYARDELVCESWLVLLPPDAEASDRGRIRAALAAGEEVELETLGARKHGPPFSSLLTISPVRNEAGELVSFVVTQSETAPHERAAAAIEEEVARRTHVLHQALHDKMELLHEVDHRVKNSLQVISSLALLKARRLGDATAQRALQGLAERISALATMHRLLSSGGDASRFDVAAFVRELSDDLMSGVDPETIALRLRVEPMRVCAAKATPLALLLNELATNALRHAFPDERRGSLGITLAREPERLRLVVEDDGIGLGARPEPGFGRTLIDMLARQLRARLVYEDARPGTRATVEIPLEEGDASP